MKDTIYREDAIKAVSIPCGTCLARDSEDCEKCSVPKLRELINAILSADRPQGEWIWHEDEDICNCSECEFEIDATGCIEPMEYVGVFRYCPNCGAYMKGADDD